MKLYETLYGKYSDSFSKIIEDTIDEVLSEHEQVLSVDIEVDPLETEVSRLL